MELSRRGDLRTQLAFGGTASLANLENRQCRSDYWSTNILLNQSPHKRRIGDRYMSAFLHFGTNYYLRLCRKDSLTSVLEEQVRPWASSASSLKYSSDEN